MTSNTRFVKCLRKLEYCEFCGRKIDVYESAMQVSGVDDELFGEVYLCDWCAVNVHVVTDGEPFESGGLREYVADALGRQECGYCGNDDYDFDLDTKAGLVRIRCETDGCGNAWEIKLDDLFSSPF